jgi:hypothetical protein
LLNEIDPLPQVPAASWTADRLLADAIVQSVIWVTRFDPRSACGHDHIRHAFPMIAVGYVTRRKQKPQWNGNEPSQFDAAVAPVVAAWPAYSQETRRLCAASR